MDFTGLGGVLVCGAGSVGERHIRNALALGIEDIRLYRQRALPLRTLARDFAVYTDLGQALAARPRVAIICNPTALHVDTAIACARAGCHLLIEKPLGDSLARVDELSAAVAASGVHVMLAYMGRFHPCVRAIHEWIHDDRIGEVVHYAARWGDYLPDWHPWEDYREGYAARRDLGGGPTHTLSHELDLLYAVLGAPVSVQALANQCSALEIDTEHGIDALLQFNAGATANLHLDFFQRPPCRRHDIVGTRGSIGFDYQAARAALYQHDSGDAAVAVVDVAASYDRNAQFVDELEYFLQCVAADRVPEPGLGDGIAVLRMACDILEAAHV